TNACYPLGTATGVALFGAVFSARLGERPVGGAEAVGTGRFELVEPALRPLARSAFSGAFTAVCLASALVCLVGVLAARMLRAGAETAGGGAVRSRARVSRPA
ncbi:MAG TPA: hypothetical protein VFP69_05600, partial [Streptomyces sp.]|nr:hypothetical protein [Streptomyces sp.]